MNRLRQNVTTEPAANKEKFCHLLKPVSDRFIKNYMNKGIRCPYPGPF